MAAMVLGLSSCKQEDDPKYHNPTTFTVCTPALQNIEFETATDMTDANTFNLFCSQPDYGYSAICSYSALVSLDPNCPEDNAVELENLTSSSAAMSIKTFELGAALCKLSNIFEESDYSSSPLAQGPVKAYFRAVCEIPGIEGSRIVSSNVVSYNAVKVNFAVKKPAWIYICGDVQTLDGEKNDFLAPNAANLAKYMENFSLFEPNDKIGDKLYVGQFNVTPKEKDPNETFEENCSQFRFFSELIGWKPDASMGSAEADFYCLSITDKWESGYAGDIVAPGLGNWGIYTDEVVPMTVVVDQLNNKIYVKEGLHEVSFVGRNPEFN